MIMSELVKEKNGVMALPEELEGKKTTNPQKHQCLFSKALFKEAYKSNKKSLWMVSGANGILMILVISILATLNINATSDAMKSLFSSASSESSIRSGAVSYYAGYEGVASAFDSADSTLSTLEDTVEQAVTLVDDSSVETQIGVIRTVYNVAYSLASGDDASKYASAKTTAMEVATLSIDSNTSLSDQEKTISKALIGNYLDAYHESSSTSYTDIMKSIVPVTLSDYIGDTYSLSETQENEVKEIFATSIDEVYTTGLEVTYVKAKESFPLGIILAETQEESASAISLLESIEEGFATDSASYIGSTDSRNAVIASAVKEAAFSTLEDSAYYAYLPTFEVKYKTSELGWPIAYEPSGEYDEDDNPILKEVEIKSYQPDRFIEVAGDMGTTSNLVQKRRKLALTGEDYTAEEIATAKAEALEGIKGLEEDISAFLDEFIARGEDGTNAYYDGSAIIDEAIVSLATEKVAEEAGDSLLVTYNEEHGTDYTSVYDIPASSSSSSGSSTMNTVYSYVSGTISSYKTILANKEAEGYSSSDAALIASVSATTAVLDQLPTSVSDSLSEMGDMNTYEIVVGMIGFAIAALLIPLAYLVMLANSLVSQKVESGSLAFTFSTPTKRSTFVFTEGVYMIFSTVVMSLVLLICSLGTRQFAILCGNTDFQTSLLVDHIALFVLGNFMVSLALSGISFLCSCLFNKSSNTLGTAGGISIFFFICAILGIFGSEAIPGTARIDAMNLFNYMTMFSLFDAHAVIEGDLTAYFIKILVLLGIALVTYIASGIVFEKKDLPL